MSCADQHRHRSDRGRLSDLGAMWTGGGDRNEHEKRGLTQDRDACIHCVEKPKQEICGRQGAAIMVGLVSVSPTVRL